MVAPQGYTRSLVRNPWILGIFSCLVVVATTSLIAHYIWRTDLAAASAEFRQATLDATDDVETRVREYEQLIRALAVIGNHHGLAAMNREWSALIAQMQPVGSSDTVSISLLAYRAEPLPYPAQQNPAAEGAGPEFTARILNIDRDRQGKSLLGYDINSDSIRREALESARDSGQVAITSPVILSRDHHAGATAGFLLIAPVYANGVPDTQDARREQLRGYIVVAYRMRDLLAPILPRLASRIVLSIADPSDGYSPLVYFETDQPHPQALFHDRHGLAVADRVWQLTYQTTPDFETRLHQLHAQRIVLAGILLALLVGWLVWRLTRSWGQAEARVHGVSGELRRYQNLLRTVLDVIPEPVLVTDRDYSLVLVNQAYADRAGMPISQLVGRETREYMPRAQAERLHLADRLVFESRQDQVFELSIPNRLLNASRSYIVTNRLAYDADGNPIVVGMHSDVTELRRKIAEFAAVIEQTPLVAVQGFDRNCVLTHWNKASEAMFGYAAGRAIGSRLQDLILEPRLQHAFERAVEDAWVEQRTFGPREVRLRLPDGRHVMLLLTLFPVIVEGVVLELFSMAVDVSARHEAERELALHRDNLQRLVDERTAGLLRAKQALEQALQARSEFLANMSHELRTPMHAVLSFARLGEERAETGATEKMRDYFSRIAQSGDRLLALINNLLDLSKFEAGKMVLARSEVNLVELIREVVSELELLADKKALRILQPLNIDVLLINIDRERIRQVLSNLLSNAIRFSPEAGSIEINLTPAIVRVGRRVTDSTESPALKISVADQGPGIPADELELIFDKFVQSSATRTGAGGTGLGLAICREIVQAHEGMISAVNREGGGAVFEVLLPCSPHAAGAD